MLAFTSKEVAEFVGVSPVMIRKIISGKNKGSPEVQAKIVAFVTKKVATVQASLEV